MVINRGSRSTSTLTSTLSSSLAVSLKGKKKSTAVMSVLLFKNSRSVQARPKARSSQIKFVSAQAIRSRQEWEGLSNKSRG